MDACTGCRVEGQEQGEPRQGWGTWFLCHSCSEFRDIGVARQSHGREGRDGRNSDMGGRRKDMEGKNKGGGGIKVVLTVMARVGGTGLAEKSDIRAIACAMPLLGPSLGIAPEGQCT